MKTLNKYQVSSDVGSISNAESASCPYRHHKTITTLQRDVFPVFSRAWDKEKILSLHEESNPRASDSDLGRSSTELKTLFGELGYSLPLSLSLSLSLYKIVDRISYLILL